MSKGNMGPGTGAAMLSLYVEHGTMVGILSSDRRSIVEIARVEQCAPGEWVFHNGKAHMVQTCPLEKCEITMNVSVTAKGVMP